MLIPLNLSFLYGEIGVDAPLILEVANENKPKQGNLIYHIRSLSMKKIRSIQEFKMETYELY